jgi:SNF family Na+-dependent transporter
MDKVTLVVWCCILILMSLVIVVGCKKNWFDDMWDSLGSIVLVTAIALIGICFIIFIPYAIVDLVGWHVSPISKTIELLTR